MAIHELASNYETLLAYVQADAPGRAQMFAGFVRELKLLAAEQGAEATRAWMQRAISPLLDYSSLVKLRRLLPSEPPRTSTENVCRIAILGGPTTIQLRLLIEVFLAGEGIAAEIYEAEYGLFRQEILTPHSGLDAFRPQFILLATGARDVIRWPAATLEDADVAAMAEATVADWLRLWEACHAKWNATVIQNNFEIQPASVFGHYSVRHSAAHQHYLERLNRLFAQQAPPYVLLHDLRGLAAEAGAKSWFDPRFYYEAKMPCGAECLVTYAHSVVSLLRAALGRSKKVMVLDLDNTLWGGTVGDLGPGGVRVGQGSGEGEAFLAFQTYAKELRQRGVLLAVCSKNDDHFARAPFLERTDMILELGDIACFVANWDNKANNLRKIAAMLSLKLDSFVFVDDNPAERAIVRRLLPEVAVPDLPDDPAGYMGAIAVHRYFETVGLTREDAGRTQFYIENARRQELSNGATDVASFLASLAMRMKVEPVNDLNIERATQLVNKSNQFNLTTRRYALAQMREIANSADWRTVALTLRDSLGDNGLIGVILLRKDGVSLAIDTWVMSCRVLQRGVEHFARNEIVDLARRERCRAISGTYIPTAKNSMVEHHFRDLGFQSAGACGGETYWTLTVDESLEELPTYIRREPSDA